MEKLMMAETKDMLRKLSDFNRVNTLFTYCFQHGLIRVFLSKSWPGNASGVMQEYRVNYQVDCLILSVPTDWILAGLCCMLWRHVMGYFYM